jgi:hypothetical protein
MALYSYRNVNTRREVSTILLDGSFSEVCRHPPMQTVGISSGAGPDSYLAKRVQWV